jgi:DNA-binding NarL/FixJ family response regulator
LSFSIYIVEDHPLVSEGIASLIERSGNLNLCGAAATASQALDEVPVRNPDLVVIDIALPDGSGIELAKQIKSLLPKQRILFVSAFDETVYAERALRAGGSGYVMKSEAANTLLEAIDVVLSGEMYVSREIRNRIVERRFRGRSAKDDPLRELSDRELEVYRMLGSGLTVNEIADTLHISAKTVESHRAGIKSKLDLDTASDVLQHAVAWRIHQEARR